MFYLLTYLLTLLYFLANCLAFADQVYKRDRDDGQTAEICHNNRISTRRHGKISRHVCSFRVMCYVCRLAYIVFSAVVLNLGSRDPLGVPNANLGGPKRKSGISTNFPEYK